MYTASIIGQLKYTIGKVTCPPEMVPDDMLEFTKIWRMENEEEIYRRANYQDIKGSRSNWQYTRSMSAAQYNRADILSMAQQIWWHGSIGCQEAEGAGEGEYRFKETGRRVNTGQPDAEGRSFKKVVSLAERRRVANYLQEAYGISERRTCKVVSISRSTKRRQSGNQKKADLVKRIHELSDKHDRYGYRKIYDMLKAEGWAVSRETVRIIRKRDGLQVAKKQRKRRPLAGSTKKCHMAEYPNHVWSYDFVHDMTADGRSLKCLTIIDEYTREGLEIYTARSITSGDVIRVLERLFIQYGSPVCLRSDNGPELVAKKLRQWLREKGVGTHYIDPGSPWQNAYNESFNGVFRDGCLDRWIFVSVREAKQVIVQWLDEYNTVRPHGSLGGKAPVTFAKKERLNRDVAA
jgi:putative transposase